MAKSIFPARQDLGFTPSTGVRANINTRTGEGAVGAAIGQTALAVAGELQERSARRAAIEVKNRKNLDDISSFKATKIREQALLDIEVMKTSIPPEQWEEQTRKIMEENIGSMDGLDFSPQESAKQKLINAGNLIGEQKKSFVSGSRKLKAQAFAAQTDQLVESFRVNGESVEAGRQATEFIASGKNNGVSASEIILNMKAAKEAGLKLRKEDILNDFQEQVSERPELTAEILENELEARSKDEGTIPEEDLSSESIQALLNMSQNRITQKTAGNQAIIKQQQDKLENDFHDELAEKGADVAEIMGRVASSPLDAPAKRRLEQDEADFASKDVNKKWPLIDNTDAVTDLSILMQQVSGGTLTQIEANKKVNEAAVNDKLTRGTFEDFRSKIVLGGADAVDESEAEYIAQVKNVLITRLTEDQARLKVRSEAGTLSSTERRKFGNNNYILQVNSHQLTSFSKELDRRLRNLDQKTLNDDIVTAEAAKLWDVYKSKSLPQRINEFQSFSGESIPKPSDFDDSIWLNASSEIRASIVEAVNKGMKNKTIEELVSK